MRVPFLRPEESGEYDYEADRKAKNFLNPGPHSIQPRQSPREEDELGVMGKYQRDAVKAEQRRQLLANDPEYQANKERRRVFDQAKIMDASVRLREENERNDAELAGLAGIEVGNMVERKKSFFDSLKHNMDKDFSSGDSSDWFGKMFEAYAGKELASTQSWMDDRVREYAVVSGRKQRDAFADMATKPHALFDDAYQMDMRNMRLLNIETTYKHLPEGELAKKRDEANAEFYERVFAKRLEVDPESARRFMSDPVVRRVFAPERLDAFDKRGESAAREMTFEATGFSWAEEGIDPEEAAKRANGLWKDKADREAAVERYAGFAYARNVQKTRENAESLLPSLRESRKSGYDPDSIPPSVRLGDPELYEVLRKDRSIRKKNGGGYPEPDYAYALEVMDGFDPDTAARTFSDRKAYGEAVLRLGGPDSPLVAALDAMVQGTATKEMKRDIGALNQARGYLLKRINPLTA